jgi:hypothetical protein
LKKQPDEIEKDDIDDNNEGVDIERILFFVRSTFKLMKSCYLLFFTILLILVFGLFYKYISTDPTYTAEAIIGPPNPSPTNSMISAMGGGSIQSAAMRRLSGAGNGNDPFQQYQQLINSPEIILSLAGTREFMRNIFNKRWDYNTNQWKKPGALHGPISSVKYMLKRPVFDQPNYEDLSKYFDKHFSISAANGDSGPISSLTSVNNYFLVSFETHDPVLAEKMLGQILQMTDDIIRREQLKDVNARISYIEGELSRISQSEQKETLVNILSSQEELKVMMVADKRFAYVLVSPPYASRIPTTPGSPGKALRLIILFSILLWGGLAAAAPYSKFADLIVRAFARKRKG